MAIDTTNKKLGVMEWEEYYEPALPLSPGVVFTQAEQQQLLWGYPGVLWVGPASVFTVSNPIVVTGVMTTSYQGSGLAPNTLAIFPRAIFWDAPNASGDKVVIKASASGAVLYTATAIAQYNSQYWRPNRVKPKGNRGGIKWQDFIVTQLDSGTLYIWYSS
jgi:hypothetical protein